MKRIDISCSLKQYANLLGKTCTVIFENGDEVRVKAFISSVWHRNKSRFEGAFSQIGEVGTDYSIYIGPSDFDITVLSRDDIVISGSKKYCFVRAEAFVVGDVVQYYTGVLKRIYEGDGYAM